MEVMKDNNETYEENGIIFYKEPKLVNLWEWWGDKSRFDRDSIIKPTEDCEQFYVVGIAKEPENNTQVYEYFMTHQGVEYLGSISKSEVDFIG